MAANKLFCVHCDEPRDYTWKQAEIVHTIRNEEIPVTADLPFCVVCGEQLRDLETEEKHYQAAIDQYRKKKNLLFPGEIVSIREMYNMSQRAFARALGFSEPTINRYELGALQDAPHNSTLILAKEPENMLKLANLNRDNLSVKEFQQLVQRAQELLQKRVEPGIQEAGFAYEKFKNMVLYFSIREAGVWKTKLMKLLFYADFVHYKKYGASISGLSYIRHKYGPVPRNHTSLLGTLEKEGAIEIDETEAGQFVGDVVSAKEPFNRGVYSESELETLQEVSERFRDHSSIQISHHSHSERCWIEIPQGQVIPYEYARYIQV